MKKVSSLSTNHVFATTGDVARLLAVLTGGSLANNIAPGIEFGLAARRVIAALPRQRPHSQMPVPPPNSI